MNRKEFLLGGLATVAGLGTAIVLPTDEEVAAQTGLAAPSVINPVILNRYYATRPQLRYTYAYLGMWDAYDTAGGTSPYDYYYVRMVSRRVPGNENYLYATTLSQAQGMGAYMLQADGWLR